MTLNDEHVWLPADEDAASIEEHLMETLEEIRSDAARLRDDDDAKDDDEDEDDGGVEVLSEAVWDREEEEDGNSFVQVIVASPPEPEAGPHSLGEQGVHEIRKSLWWTRTVSNNEETNSSLDSLDSESSTVQDTTSAATSIQGEPRSNTNNSTSGHVVDDAPGASTVEDRLRQEETIFDVVHDHQGQENVGIADTTSTLLQDLVKMMMASTPAAETFVSESEPLLPNESSFFASAGSSIGRSIDRCIDRLRPHILLWINDVRDWVAAARTPQSRRLYLVLLQALLALYVGRCLVIGIGGRVLWTATTTSRSSSATMKQNAFLHNKVSSAGSTMPPPWDCTTATLRPAYCDPAVGAPAAACHTTTTTDRIDAPTSKSNISLGYLSQVAPGRGGDDPLVRTTVDNTSNQPLESESSFSAQPGTPPTWPKSLAEALDQARTYEQQIVMTTTYPESILNELVPGGLWDQWTLHAQRHPVLSLFYVPSQVKELRSIMTTVQKHLVRHIRHAMAAAPPGIATTNGAMVNFYQLRSRFRDAASAMLAYFSFTRLMQQFESPLLTHVIGELGSEIEIFETQLTVIFTSLSSAIHGSSVADDPVVLCETLDFVQTSPVLDAARIFSQQSPLSTDRRRGRTTELILAIAECTDYEQLQGEAVRLLQKHSTVLDTFTFDLSGTDNEHERRFQFEKVRHSLAFVSAALCLRTSLSLRYRSSVPDFHEQREKALNETHKVGQRAIDVFTDFPNHEGDFPVLRRAMGNLATLADIFRDQDPALASAARNIAQDAEKRFRVRLGEFSAEICLDYGSVLRSILQLKRASREVPLWESELNVAIDQCLDKGARLSINTGRFLLTLSLELRTMEGTDAPLAKQLIAEHRCFEWAVNAIYNAATARQGIDYVVTKMELKRKEAVKLKLMYEAFDVEYNALLGDGFSMVQAGKTDEFLGYLVTRVKEIASDKVISHSDRTWLLSAHIFAFWTLDNASNLSTLPDGMDDFSAYLKKPHAPQVTAIWQLLGSISHSDLHQIENHFVELKTGEGKSIVLGIASIILALSNYDVTVICYSAYLSQRDFDDFNGMFTSFGVDQSINYGTVDHLVESLMSRTGDIRSLTTDTIRGKDALIDPTLHDYSGKQKVLLVDEVDVFFNKDFFGQSYRPVGTLSTAQARDLVSYIWKNRGHLSKKDLILSNVVQDCIESVDKKFGRLIQLEALAMLHDARNVDAWQPYIVSEEHIAYKHFDGLTFSLNYGYETMFAYLKEYENGAIPYATVEEYLGILVSCGEISYAELPTMFDYIMGVSGTVRGLSKDEIKILSDVYAVKKLSHVPSAYGENQLEFRKDDPRDILLTSSKEEYFLEIRNEIAARRKPRDGNQDVRRAILVFFANTSELLEFYESKQMEDLKRETRVLTEAISPSEKRSAFTKATEQGAITLLIRDYGRGTDFRCFDTRMLDAGGPHVIQAFYSPELAEEIQIKGRTARQGTKGSYSMVLNFEQLKQDLGVSWDDFTRMKNKRDYGTLLEEKRSTLASVRNRNTMEAVKDRETMHYRTLAFLNSMSVGDNLPEVANFILEQHGDQVSPSFQSNTLKDEFIMQRTMRMVKTKIAPSFRIDLAAALIARIVELPKTAVALDLAKTDYYKLLGLPKNVSKIALMGSLRLLEGQFQTQKRRGEGGDEPEKLLNMTRSARSVLMDDHLRAAYDFLISAPEVGREAEKGQRQ